MQALNGSAGTEPQQGAVGPLLAIDEVADRLNVTPRFVRRLIAERRIRYFKLGRHVRLAEEDVDDWVRRRRIDPSMT
jgi:excisionase family DNA binding protein